MHLNLRTIAAFVLLAAVAPAAARTTSQFRNFFPAWQSTLFQIMDESCQAQRDAYFDASNESTNLPYDLANCLLDKLDEFRKSEMGITAVVLGLLPTMLQQVGPSVAEVSLLATRRPLLAFLLGLAMPSVSTGGPLANPAEVLRRPVDLRIRVGLLDRAAWIWGLISAFEYLIAGAAVANVFHQVYQLAYWSISVSSIAIDSGGISKTYAPFLWLILLVPAHLFGFWNLKLRYRSSEPGPESENLLKRKTWVQVIGSEFVPCIRGDPLLLDKMEKGVLSVLVQYLTQIAAVIVFAFGTVALSSQIFISLGDVVPIIARFLLCTLVCRVVLSFELHGLRETTSQSTQGSSTVLLGSGYRSVDRKEAGGIVAEHRVA